MIRGSRLVSKLPRLRRAFDAERGFWSHFQPCGGNVFAAADAGSISAIFDPIESALNRRDLAGYKQRLTFKRCIILGLDRPFRRIGIKRLGQISLKVREPRLQFLELRLKAGLRGRCVCHEWRSEMLARWEYRSSRWTGNGQCRGGSSTSQNSGAKARKAKD